jgi:hypothetical protein
MKQNASLAVPHLIAANSLVAFLAVAVLVAAACSESTLPTESKLGVQPHPASIVQGGCPNPFTAVNVLDADGLAADRNADGVACSLTDNGIVVSWVDNDVPLSQRGACPNGFDLAASGMTWMETFDHNGDSFVCTRINGGGNTIVIDNNNPYPTLMR